MFRFNSKEDKSPKDQMKEWKRSIRKEKRGLERQIRGALPVARTTHYTARSTCGRPSPRPLARGGETYLSVVCSACVAHGLPFDRCCFFGGLV